MKKFLLLSLVCLGSSQMIEAKKKCKIDVPPNTFQANGTLCPSTVVIPPCPHKVIPQCKPKQKSTTAKPCLQENKYPPKRNCSGFCDFNKGFTLPASKLTGSGNFKDAWGGIKGMYAPNSPRGKQVLAESKVLAKAQAKAENKIFDSAAFDKSIANVTPTQVMLTFISNSVYTMGNSVSKITNQPAVTSSTNCSPGASCCFTNQYGNVDCTNEANVRNCHECTAYTNNNGPAVAKLTNDSMHMADLCGAVILLLHSSDAPWKGGKNSLKLSDFGLNRLLGGGFTLYPMFLFPNLVAACTNGILMAESIVTCSECKNFNANVAGKKASNVKSLANALATEDQNNKIACDAWNTRHCQAYMSSMAQHNSECGQHKSISLAKSNAAAAQAASLRAIIISSAVGGAGLLVGSISAFLMFKMLKAQHAESDKAEAGRDSQEDARARAEEARLKAARKKAAQDEQKAKDAKDPKEKAEDEEKVQEESEEIAQDDSKLKTEGDVEESLDPNVEPPKAEEAVIKSVEKDAGDKQEKEIDTNLQETEEQVDSEIAEGGTPTGPEAIAVEADIKVETENLESQGESSTDATVEAEKNVTREVGEEEGDL